VKNVFDETAITGAFLNSDDSGLTTNVFLTEPRLYGLRVTKDWSGSVFGWVGSGRRRTPGEPYPFQIELGGGVSRLDRDAETYSPDWVTPVLESSPKVQEEELDWGDIRSVKLTYAPEGGWAVSGAYRFGKTNLQQGRGAAYEAVPTGILHVFGSGETSVVRRDNRAITSVHEAEEYAVADFMVGKEIGLGAFGDGGRSTVSAGLRYAKFDSSSRVYLAGITESYVAPHTGFKYPGAGFDHWNDFNSSLESEREFEGMGPAVSWDASLRLWGSDEDGHADLDWGVGTGVLFGKQTMESIEDRFGQYTRVGGSNHTTTRTTLYDVMDTVRHRTDDVTVPNLTLAVGLSYAIDRVKVSTGYSYDRFFDAIDGGVAEAKQYDRTIQGPYFRISVGFGGS
jgi:iron complex outermembrane receptor protein